MKPRLKIKLAFSIVLTWFSLPNTTFAHDTDEIESFRFVLANVRFTVMHELAHALIEVLQIPVLGHEEDAADQMAATAWLMPHDDHQLQLDEMIMAADAWRLEWALRQFQAHDIDCWSDHALDIQRFFNIACLIYGSDPDALEVVRKSLGLPIERAWFCQDEYQKSAHALNWIIDRHAPRTDSAQSWLSIEYEQPATQQRAKILAALKAEQVLEEIVERAIVLIHIDEPIRIVMANCGDPGAFWRSEIRELVFCNELLDRFYLLAQLRHCVPIIRGLGRDANLTEEAKSCLTAEPDF